VEPTNALYSGVDLVEACLALALGATAEPVADGVPDVTTHQTLLALLGAAERAGRRGAVRELGQAMFRRGPYRNSREELTPLHHDVRTVLPVALVAIAVGVRPAWWTRFASGAIENYALTSSAWTAIRGESA
jgi:hypothetical protein